MMNRIHQFLYKARIRKLKKDLRRSRYGYKYQIVADLPEPVEIVYSISDRKNSLSPALILAASGEILKHKIKQCPAIPVEIVCVKEGAAIARTDGFVVGDTLFHLDVLLRRNDRSLSKYKSFYVEPEGGEHIACVPRSMSRVQRVSGVAISLLHEYSYNYYHFLFECLPKLMLIRSSTEIFEKNESDEGTITILIDENTPSQCVELVSLLCPSEVVRISRVSVNQIVKCDRLYYCTPFFHSIDDVYQDRSCPSDFYLDSLAISLVKKASLQLDSVYVKPYRRLYMERAGSLKRQLENAQGIRALLESYGFETVHLENYSALEQIRLFRESSCVVGASGAAFSNIIHMQPSTKAVMFSPKVEGMNYHLFQQQADCAGVELIHLLTDSVEDGVIHSGLLIDLEYLEMALKVIFASSPRPLS